MSPETVVEAINKKREELIKIGMDKGLTSDETIKCSQELDQLLNVYNHLLSQTEIFKPTPNLNLFTGFIFVRKLFYKYMVTAIIKSLKTLRLYQ